MVAGLRLERRIGVLDLGARRPPDAPPPAYEPLVELQCCDVIGVEADPAECRRLSSQAQAEGRPERFVAAVVGRGDERVLHECEMPSRSSLYEPDHRIASLFNAFDDGSRVVGRRRAATRQVDELVEPGEIDLLCMDLQGAELDALAGAKRVLQDALFVHTEVKFIAQYHGQPLFGDVDQTLRKSGFAFHTFTGFGSRCLAPLAPSGDPLNGLNQWLWADAVYVRGLVDLLELPDQALLRTAIVAHAVYESYDLAHFALAELDRRHGMHSAPEYASQLESG